MSVTSNHSMSVHPLAKPWGSFWKQQQIAASFPVNTELAWQWESVQQTLSTSDGQRLELLSLGALEMQLEEYQLSPQPWTTWWADRTCLP